MTMGITSPTSTTGQILKNGSAVISFDANNNATFSGNVAPSVNPTMRNRIINGAMVIDQRNAGASVSTSTTGSQTYSLDRWGYVVSQASKFTIQQNAGSVTPPIGFTNYLGCTSTAATSVGSSDYFNINQVVEGFNVADLGWGTANAKTVTISFWVYSSLTGTFGGSLRNSAFNRSYPYTYTISSANTWEQKTVTIAGDTTGTWLTNNGHGIQIIFSLGMGSTYSGTAGVWASANYASATGATSVVGTNGATFYITGVQLEAGSVATPFEQRLYGTELALCQRYYYKNKGDGAGNGPYGMGHCRSNYLRGLIHLPVIMRTTPTMTNTGTDADYIVTSGTSDFTSFVTRPSLDNGGNQILAFRVQVSTGMTNGYAALLSLNSSSSYLDFSAEL
jgi:hypothetical protein